MGNTHPTKKYDSLTQIERGSLSCNKCLKIFAEVKYACKVTVMKEDSDESTSVKLYYFHSKAEMKLQIIDARRTNKFHVWKVPKGQPFAILFRIGKYNHYCTRCMITTHKHVLDTLCADMAEKIYIVDIEGKYVFNALHLNVNSQLNDQPMLECIQCLTTFTDLKFVGHTRMQDDTSQQHILCPYYYRFSPCENLAFVGLPERNPDNSLRSADKEPTAAVPTNVPLLGMIVIKGQTKCFKCISNGEILRFLNVMKDRIFLIMKKEGKEILHFIKNSPSSPNLRVPGAQQHSERSALAEGLPLPCIYRANAKYADPSMEKYDPVPGNILIDGETGGVIISPRSARRTTLPAVLPDGSISYMVQRKNWGPAEEVSKLTLVAGSSGDARPPSPRSRSLPTDSLTRSEGDTVQDQPEKKCGCPGACACNSNS